MFNPPQAQYPVRQAPDLPAAALQDDHFEAMVVVQVDMGGCKDLACGRMLGFNQLGGKIRLVVVVNHGQCSDNHLVLIHRLVDQSARE